MGKKLRTSKTFIVNLLMVAAGAIGGAMATDFISENPAMVGYFGAAMGAVNIALRLITGKPIEGI